MRVRIGVVIPARDEEQLIGRCLESVLASARLVDARVDIVVAADGCLDATSAVARRYPGVRVLELESSNVGAARAAAASVALRRGATWLASTDADSVVPPQWLARHARWQREGWDVVVGSRYHHDTTTVVAARRLREVGGRVINGATRLVLDGGHGDTQCGLKAFRSDIAGVLFGHSRVDGFAFDVELFLLVERYGFSLTEVPVQVENSERSTVHVARDAARLLVDLAGIRRAARRGAYDLRPGALDHLVPGPGPDPGPGAAGPDE